MYTEQYENIYGDVAILESYADIYADENALVNVTFDNQAYADFTSSYEKAWQKLYKLGFRE